MQDVIELNRAALDIARRLALIDTVVCANILRIQPDEANALANMPDLTMEHIAQGAICVCMLEYDRPLYHLSSDAPRPVLELQKEFISLSEAIHAAAHRYAMESASLCEAYFRATPEQAARLGKMSELARRALPATCTLRMNGIAQVVDLINRERSMPQYATRLSTSLLAARLATLPL